MQAKIQISGEYQDMPAYKTPDNFSFLRNLQENAGKLR